MSTSDQGLLFLIMSQAPGRLWTARFGRRVDGWIDTHFEGTCSSRGIQTTSGRLRSLVSLRTAISTLKATSGIRKVPRQVCAQPHQTPRIETIPAGLHPGEWLWRLLPFVGLHGYKENQLQLAWLQFISLQLSLTTVDDSIIFWRKRNGEYHSWLYNWTTIRTVAMWWRWWWWWRSLPRWLPRIRFRTVRTRLPAGSYPSANSPD